MEKKGAATFKAKGGRGIKTELDGKKNSAIIKMASRETFKAKGGK